MKCDVCSADLPPRADNPNHPFCSKRCKLVDLGRWLGGEYVIPGPPDPDAFEALASQIDGPTTDLDGTLWNEDEDR